MTSREEIFLALMYFFDVETESNVHEIIGQDDDPLGTIATALDEYRKVDSCEGWIKCSERMPEAGVMVLVYTPPQPHDYPEDVRIEFDCIDPEAEDPSYWLNHGENYEHFCCVAKGDDCMTGPSEKAPYTHWQPLPEPPQESSNDKS